MSTSHPTPPQPTPDPEDAWLEKILRQPPASTPSTPAGADDAAAFTARVLASLPPATAQVRRATRRRRAGLIAGAALLGSIVAWLGGGDAFRASVDAVASLTQTAGMHASQTDGWIVHTLAGVSAVAMFVLLGRRGFRRLIRSF